MSGGEGGEGEDTQDDADRWTLWGWCWSEVTCFGRYSSEEWW